MNKYSNFEKYKHSGFENLGTKLEERTKNSYSFYIFKNFLENLNEQVSSILNIRNTSIQNTSNFKQGPLWISRSWMPLFNKSQKIVGALDHGCTCIDLKKSWVPGTNGTPAKEAPVKEHPVL